MPYAIVARLDAGEAISDQLSAISQRSSPLQLKADR
jgi:hypothetical protein